MRYPLTCVDTACKHLQWETARIQSQPCRRVSWNVARAGRYGTYSCGQRAVANPDGPQRSILNRRAVLLDLSRKACGGTQYGQSSPSEADGYNRFYLMRRDTARRLNAGGQQSRRSFAIVYTIASAEGREEYREHAPGAIGRGSARCSQRPTVIDPSRRPSAAEGMEALPLMPGAPRDRINSPRSIVAMMHAIPRSRTVRKSTSLRTATVAKLGAPVPFPPWSPPPKWISSMKMGR